MARLSDVAALRARLAPHGYHVFLQPDRPSGWLVILRGPDDAGEPITASAASRSAALELAERLFVHHRLQELDTAIRERGLSPPSWQGTQEAHLAALAQFAREQHVAA